MADTIQKLDESHRTSDPHPASALRTYYIVFAWLMGLLVLTVLAAQVDLDHLFPGLNLLVAMMIAVAKGGLVVLFFMHVKQSSKLTWIFASAAFVWLAIMFAYSFSDYLTRTSLPEAVITTPDKQRYPVFEHVDKNTNQPVSHD